MTDRFLIWLSGVGEDAKRRIINFLVSLDQLVFSVITLGDSDPDETISAAAWRLEQNGRWQGKLFRLYGITC